MKLTFHCYYCNPRGVPGYGEILKPYQESRRYLVECSRGHKVSYFLDRYRFEILGKIASDAMAQSAYRDAISNFNSSLERFYEFYIRVILAARGVGKDEIEASWKNVASSSERQLGSFVSLCTIEDKRPPSLLDNDLVNLRNRVVHKGYIPTEAEASAFSKAVIERIYPRFKRVMEGCGPQCLLVESEREDEVIIDDDIMTSISWRCNSPYRHGAVGSVPELILL